jgi:hypothetical protein
MSYTIRKLLVCILWLNWLLFAFSINHNLFHKFRNYKKAKNFEQGNNDELGGSLFEAVSPKSAGKTDIFDHPSKPIIKSENSQPNLESALKKINDMKTDKKKNLAKTEIKKME